MAIWIASRKADGNGEDALSPKAMSEAIFKDLQHDLTSLLGQCEATFNAFMPGQRDAFVGLSECINELSAHDPSSYSFRYPTGKMLDSGTLQNLKCVDLEHFQKTAGKVSIVLMNLQKQLDERLEDLNFDISDYY